MSELLSSDWQALVDNDPAIVAYLEWQGGNITDREALNVLCVAIAATDDQIKPLAERAKVLRELIGNVVAHGGDPVEIPGFGRLEITNPVVTPSYDRKKLDSLIIELAGEYSDVAARIAQCRTESMRSGSLRITREKQK